MIDLGTVRPGSTIRIPFNSFDKDDGSSITMTNFAVGDILIYKDGNTTARASTSGFTATTDFSSKTGKQLAIIDLADNTTAGFFNAGSEYLVAIDAVTIDAVTTGGWTGRFRIGYPGAVLDTTIATLATQTSFTLTVGPAEDDALNGMWAVIHDVASAVQCSWVLIADYTGSTKTVTLVAGATFTAAATDNISVMFPAPLQPTTLGAKLDVSAGGEAGLDWANVGSPTTTLNLSGTTVKTATDVETKIGTPTNLGGGSATLAGNLQDIEAQTDDIGVAGAGLTNINLPDQTMNITGDITGNLSGSVGSVTADVGITQAGADKVWGTAARTLTAFGFAVDISAAGVQAVWDALTAALTTVGSIGKWIVDKLDVAISTRGTGTALDAAGVRAAVGLASATLDTQLAALPTATENADEFLDRDMSVGTDSGSTTVRTPRQALRFLRNKWDVTGGTLTVKKEDDSTTSWTAAVTADAAANPIVASDPAGP